MTPPRQQQRTVTPPGQRAQKPTPNPQSIRVQKPKINPDDEVVYVRVPFSLKDLPQGTYKSQLEWCETVGVRFVFRHHGASKKHKWDSSRITLQGPQAHHAWSVLLKEYKEILPAPLWKKVSKVGILYIRGNYDGKIDDELKDESDEDSEVDFKDEPKDDVTKLPLKSFEKEGPLMMTMRTSPRTRLRRSRNWLVTVGPPQVLVTVGPSQPSRSRKKPSTMRTTMPEQRLRSPEKSLSMMTCLRLPRPKVKWRHCREGM